MLVVVSLFLFAFTGAYAPFTSSQAERARVEFASNVSREQVAGRPLIVLVHGRGVLLRDTTSARVAWQRALEAGASTLVQGKLLHEDDVRVAWYAGALDPRAALTCSAPHASPAATSTTEADSAAASLRNFFALAGAGLNAFLEIAGEQEQGELRAIAGDMLFIGDPLRRCSAEDRLADVLALAAEERRPVILLAHSFGSLLSYGYLHSTRAMEQGHVIHRYITVGSLLGAPGAREIVLGDRRERVQLPPGAGGWTNVRDVRDGLAYAIPVSPGDSTRRVTDLTTAPDSRVADPHDILHYLRDPVTARVVMSAWCEAFGNAGGASATRGVRAARGAQAVRAPAACLDPALAGS
jgi:hypothetical protein